MRNLVIVVLVIMVTITSGCGANPQPDGVDNVDIQETATQENLQQDSQDEVAVEKNIKLENKNPKPDTDESTWIIFENDTSYKGDPLEVEIKSDKDILAVHYTFVADVEKSSSFHLEPVVKEYSFSVPTDDLIICRHELQVAVQLKGEDKCRGESIQLDIVPKPDISVDYDRYKWEEPQAIVVSEASNSLLSVVYVDPDNQSQVFKREEARDGNVTFTLETKLPPPDSTVGKLVFTSDIGLRHSIPFGSYDDNTESRVYFYGIKKMPIGDEIIAKFYVASNSLLGDDFRIEAEIPRIFLKDKVFSEYIDYMDHTSSKFQHVYNEGTISFVSDYISISPNARFYIFRLSREMDIDKDVNYMGRRLKKIDAWKQVVFDSQTGSYDVYDRGYHYEFHAREEEGSLILNQAQSQPPLYWTSDTTVVMLKSIYDGGIVASREITDDPEITYPSRLFPPGSTASFVEFDVVNGTTKDIPKLEPPRVISTFACQTTGITGWVGLYDPIRRNMGIQKPYIIANKDQSKQWTVDDIIESVNIGSEIECTVSIIGTTNYQNIPRAILDIEGGNMDFGDPSLITYKRLIALFDVETGESETLIDYEPEDIDDLDHSPIPYDFQLLQSCDMNPETPPLLLLHDKLQTIEDSEFVEYSIKKLWPDEYKEDSHSYRFIR